MAATMLTAGLLDRLACHPAVRGAPILEAWAPGLTDAEMDELTVPLEIRLPEELRVFWRWHNGTIDTHVFRLGGFEPMSLQEAIDAYHRERELEAETGFGPGESFPALFFPFAMNFSDTTAADCTDPERSVAPVHYLPSHDVRDESIAMAEVASLGEWAAWQIKALDDGYYRWDQGANRWATAPIDDAQRPLGPAFLSHFRGWR